MSYECKRRLKKIGVGILVAVALIPATVFYVLASIALAGFLTGCGGTDEPEGDEPTVSLPTPVDCAHGACK